MIETISESQSLSKLLICGLGSIGKRHLTLIKEYWPSIEVAVLRSGKGGFCSELKLIDQLFHNMNDAIAWKPDASIISSPATYHLSQALPLAKCGVPLLIEKPVGTSHDDQSDWSELLTVSKKIPIDVAYVLRHDPCAVVVKDMLNERIIGNICEADFYCGSWLPHWRKDIDYRDSVSARNALGGGVLYELSHDLDLAQCLLGSLQIQNAILRNTGTLELDVEDQSIVMAQSKDGILVTARLNFCTQPSRRYYTFRGSTGEIVWDVFDRTVILTRLNDQDRRVYRSSISINDLYRIQMQSFLDCAKRKVQPICTLSDGLMTLGLIEKIHAKATISGNL